LSIIRHGYSLAKDYIWVEDEGCPVREGKDAADAK
jgi:hypothetical protein